MNSARDITIRPYEAADLPTLRWITVESFGGVAMEQLQEQKWGCWNGRNWKQRKADHIDDDCSANPSGVFVAEREGLILGYITTRVDALNARGRIPNMAVTAETRGLGLGRRLIEHALEYFRSLGLQIAVIETMDSNEVGQHLYPSCGFEETGRLIHYSQRL